MLVNDKARQSVREIQEREMNAIVFDDTDTPKFRHRNLANTNEDKQLEEILNKPTEPSEPAADGHTATAAQLKSQVDSS